LFTAAATSAVRVGFALFYFDPDRLEGNGFAHSTFALDELNSGRCWMDHCPFEGRIHEGRGFDKKNFA